jgi:lipopolysaccharide export system permease protein
MAHAMVVNTLGRYFALDFLRTVIAVFVGIFALVTVIDFVELLRRAGSGSTASAWVVAETAMCRVPQLSERILPFTILIGAMVSFLRLSRRLELVVVRSAGISAWQFLAPALVVAILIGVAATMVYNPLSATLQERSKRLEPQIFGDRPSVAAATPTSSFWLRQRTDDGQSILQAKTSTSQGHQLFAVTAYVFDQAGRFVERVEAASATLRDGFWQLDGVRLYPVDAAPETRESYDLKTSLTAEQVRETFATPESVPFWQLPGYIDAAENAGLRAAGYRLQYQKLLAQPLLLAAMVLLAAAVSLRFFRFGGTQKMVVAGILGGFAIYVLSKVMDDLTKAELMSPVAAAWTPIAVGGLTGLMALLFLEDG